MTRRITIGALPRTAAAAALVVLALGISACGADEERERAEPVAPGTTAPATTAPEPPAPRELPPSLAGAEWDAIPTRRKVVALTFDCGGSAAGVPSILRTLDAARAPATFFLTGAWVDAFPDEARAVGARYPVGNHTYSHSDLTTVGPAAVRRELTRAARLIREVAGREPRPLFRFPYGARDGRTIALVNALGYGSIRWTVDTLGWQGAAAGQSAATVRARVLAALRPGAIVLMHVGAAPDGTTLDADALPGLVRAVRARGYELVSLAEFVR